MKRRDFIKNSGITLAATSVNSPLFWEKMIKEKSKIGANDRIRIGLIGANGMGFADLDALLKIPETECIALCDIEQNVIRRRNKVIENRGVNKQAHYTDYRKLHINIDID